jgi:hypothetical protein
MATKRILRPRDPIALAKLIGDIATGQVVDAVEDEKSAAAVDRGRLGGKSGGRARADKLTDAQRREIAEKGAAARWGKRAR